MDQLKYLEQQRNRVASRHLTLGNFCQTLGCDLIPLQDEELKSKAKN